MAVDLAGLPRHLCAAGWRDCSGNRPGLLASLGLGLVVVDCYGRLFDLSLHLCGSGALSKTWLTGETALAVDLVGSSRQTWSLGNAMADSETSVTFPPYFQPCTLSIFHFRPFPLSRDESLLFLMPCFPPSLSLSTPFPASRGMTSSLLAALRAKRETAYPFSCSSSSLALSLRHHLPDKTSPPLAG